MIKRIVVAGCRNFEDYEIAEKYIDMCIQNIREKYGLIFVSGGCSGADRLGELYAEKNGFDIELHPADWKKYGRAAGPKRNKEMADVSDYVICFWDGKSIGTKNIIECARKLGKPVRIKKIRTTP